MKKEEFIKNKSSPKKILKREKKDIRYSYNETMLKVDEYFGIKVPKITISRRIRKKGKNVGKISKNSTSNNNIVKKKSVSNNVEKNKLPKLKIAVIFLLAIVVLSGTYSWFYSEFTSKGTIFGVGKLECKINQYSASGELIGEIGDTGTLIEESDISAGKKATKYLELTNTGSLDLQYNITFTLDDQDENSGIMYYRLYDITEEVQSCEVTALFDTKLKMYAHKNPIDTNIEFDTARPVYNMTIIDTTITNGVIELDLELEENNKKYYRLDYGVYSTANASIYSERNFALHTNVYISQVGSEFKGENVGQVWEVENEQQFRNAASKAMPADTIKLMSDIYIDGSVSIIRKVSLDLNEHLLDITGDLVYNFIEVGQLNISTKGNGRIKVGKDLLINAPKSTIYMVGQNSDYDIYVGGTFTVNGLQNEEQDGVLLDNIRIVNNTITNVPVNMTVMSNTRVTIGPNVILGNVIAYDDSTNIEILNNGTIVQIVFDKMSLLETFTKPQIYIYNLNVIKGAVGTSSIILPKDSSPYKGPGDGNTLIIKGVNSSDITISGSDNFNQEDITYSDITESVVPIIGKENSYYVYIRNPQDSIENLLTEYFKEINPEEIDENIALIERLVIYTVNAQYVENEDFDYLNSEKLPALNYLNLKNARVIDDSTVNRIKSNALSNKDTIKTLILPDTLNEIGSEAFSGLKLGKIPSSNEEEFVMLNIPDGVVKIGNRAFDAAEYISFAGLNPPQIQSDSFSNDAKLFVNEGSIELYQKTENYNEENIFIASNLSDDKTMFVYNTVNGLGVSLYVSTLNVGDNLTIPNTISYLNRQYYINEIGVSAFRHIVTNDTGVNVTLPSRVEKIKAYAFCDVNVNKINLENITEIRKHAFRNTNITEIIADKVTIVGAHAFENTKITKASFESLVKVEEYALNNCKNLYELNLGMVQYMGDYAVGHAEQLGRVYFKNNTSKIINNAETINLVIGEGSVFSDWGKYLDGRLRVYVPDGITENSNTYLQLYKNLFSANANYVYVTGEIIGSYNHVAIDYDFGEYAIREVTITGNDGIEKQGYEIITYIGKDLTEDYEIPTTFTVNDVTKDVISIGDSAYSNTLTQNGALVNISNDVLLNIGNRAFYGSNINKVNFPNVKFVGVEAFSKSSITELIFDNLYRLSTKALYDIETLYSLNVGKVCIVEENVIEKLPNIEQIFFTNSDVDNMQVSQNNFVDISKNTKQRLRIYVPENNSKALEYYKTIVGNNSTYVYETGHLLGSYINSPIPYDIGEYMVRSVTLQDVTGAFVNGWEIIEYHGADLVAGYEVPTEFTINSVTANVISIGERAYIHSTYSSDLDVDIDNDKLLNIGSYAFYGAKGINSITAASLRKLGAHAFDSSSIKFAKFDNLDTIEEFALSNMPTLYMIDLGTVKNMASNSIHNLEKLVQVYFRNTTTSVNYAKDSIVDVGMETVNRIRFYVTDALGEDGKPLVDTYKRIFKEEIQDYFFPVGITVGEYTPSNIPYDIGSYTARQVTIEQRNGTNITGWELIEYHGQDLRSSYKIPERLALNNSSLSAELTASNTWGNYTTQFTVAIKNNGTEAVNSWEANMDLPSNVNLDTVWNANYTKSSTYVTFSNVEYNGSIAPSESITFTIQITTPIQNYVPYLMVVDSSSVTQAGLKLISIGENAYSHVKVEEGNRFSVNNQNLIRLSKNAFKNMKAITKVEFENLEYVEDYALYGNYITEASFENLYKIGEYALADNSSLNYLNLGKVKNIGTNFLGENTRVAQLVFSNSDIIENSKTVEITFDSTTLENINLDAGKRFRIYVPSGTTPSGIKYVDAYKNTFSSFSDYIYEEGEIVGSYIQSPIEYDLGEYSVKEVVLKDAKNNDITGFEIVEYHGKDLPLDYLIPKQFTINGVTHDVISIGDYAYYNCKVAEDFYLELTNDNNIISIGNYAFSKLKLNSLTTDKLLYIGKNAFEDCEYLAKVELESVKKIDEYAFNSISRLENVIIGNKIESIGNYAFYNPYNGGVASTEGPDTNFVISANVAPIIDEYTFPECKDILGQNNYNYFIEVPSNAVGYDSVPWPIDVIRYVNYTGSFSYIVTSSSTAKITSYVGSDEVLELPSSVSLDEIVYEITSVSANAFDTNTTLKEITLPRTIKSIDNKFLAGNKTIQNIQVAEDNLYYNSVDGILFAGDVLVKYPNGKEQTEYILPENTKAISLGAFNGCTNLQSIVFNSNLFIISSNSFDGCSGLVNLKFVSTEVPYLLGSSVFPNNENLNIKVPSELVETYKNKIYFNEYSDKITSLD